MADLTIRTLNLTDRDPAIAVINAAARWYADFLSPEEFDGTEMTPAQWQAESARLTWYGAFVERTLVGVMGLEYVRDVALVRHGYVLPQHQRRGVGSRLLQHVEAQVRGPSRIVVGTYARNQRARRALEQAGYQLSANAEAVLRAYYLIPEDRLQSSVTYEKATSGCPDPGTR